MPVNNLSENLTNLSESSGFKRFLKMPIIGSIGSKNKKDEDTKKKDEDTVSVPKKFLAKLLNPPESEPQVEPLQAFNNDAEILTNIYNVMRMDHATFMKNMIADRKFDRKIESVKESRTKDLINLFSGKKVEREKKEKVKKEIEELKKKLDDLEKKKEARKAEETAGVPAPTAPKAPATPPAAPAAKPTPVSPSPGAAPTAPTPAPTVTTPKVTGAPSAVPAAKPAITAPTVAKVPAAIQQAPTAVIAGKVAAAAGGVLLSSAALATIKSEQGVKSAEDALSPNNNPKRVKIGEFADLNTPKVGAATPDVNNSTSYGLFGINNIRGVDKTGKETPSSIDGFVKMFPQLGLPDPGDPKNPQQVKAFNDSWWKLAKNKPKDLFAAQMQYFKKRYEDPAAASVKGKIDDLIANDQKVIDFLTDRRVQFGGTLFNSALAYSKSAKTPEEFVNLITEHDLKNLRSIFKSTSDEKFAELKVGLVKRLRDRQLTATGKTFIPEPEKEKTKILSLDVGDKKYSPDIDVMRGTGPKLNESSKENQDLKKQSTSSVTPSATVLNNINNISKGANIYQTPDENKHTPAVLNNQYK